MPLLVHHREPGKVVVAAIPAEHIEVVMVPSDIQPKKILSPGGHNVSVRLPLSNILRCLLAGLGIRQVHPTHHQLRLDAPQGVGHKAFQL